MGSIDKVVRIIIAAVLVALYYKGVPPAHWALLPWFWLRYSYSPA